MSDIGKAYVQIIPTAEGIKGRLEQAISGEASSAGSKAGSAISGGIGKALGGVAKITAGAVAATSTAVSALAKESVQAYADFEQLEGGIETLFGAAAPHVMKNAEKAFLSAGQSANEYMETSIQSAAALINSLGGNQAEAARLMDVSIVDMADNVNKMGTSMEGVQNAYRGFSRGNFTMLDNLALGFAGTKQGMQELLEKAKELSGVEYDIESYADIVQAIHVVQESMGIAGTTAKEGVETISGSISTLKSAWSNLIAGFGRNDVNLDKLIGDVVDSAGKVLENMQPIVEKALEGISSFISKAAPILAEQLPVIIENALPSVLNAAVDLVEALVRSLPQILSSLMSALPGALERAISTLTENADLYVDSAVKMVEMITDGIVENADTIIPAAVELLVALTEALLDHTDELLICAIKLVVALTDAIIDSRDELLKAGPELMDALVSGCTGAFFKLDDLGFQTINRFIDALQLFMPNLIPTGMDFIINVVQGIIRGLEKLFSAGEDSVVEYGKGIQSKFGEATTWGGHLVEAFVRGIEFKHPLLMKAVNGLTNIVASRMGFSEPEEGPLSNFHTYAPDMIDLFSKGITDNSGKLKAAVNSLAGDVSDAMPNVTNSIRNGGSNSSVALAGYGDITIPVYIGNQKFTQAVVKADKLNNYRSGGR